jgi:lysophospholipase L1-like esterase
MTGRVRLALAAVASAAALLAALPSAGAAPRVPTVVVPPEPAPAAPSAIAHSTYDRQWPVHPPWDACPRPVWPGRTSAGWPGGGRRVVVIGDSLTRESRVLSAKGMRASGWTPTFRCWGSRRLDWGLDQVARAKDLGQLPRFVILALGTNDISWETPATTERRVRALVDRLGPHRQILWVDLHLTRSAWLDARAAWFNGLLRELARTHPNLTVVGWHRVARAHGIHGWDGIHYGPYGYRLRARTVLAGLNEVGRRHPVVARPAPMPAPTPIPTTAPAPTPIATPGPSGSSGPAPAP